MSKIFYQTCVFGFFHASAPSVLKKYAPLTRKIDESPNPDYRLVLSEIIGDYLFRCPNRLFANRLSHIQNPVFLYEFSLPTKTPGYPCCDGISCHTCELPYVFGQMGVIRTDYSWTGEDNNNAYNTDIQNYNQHNRNKNGTEEDNYSKKDINDLENFKGDDSTYDYEEMEPYVIEPEQCVSENFSKNMTREKDRASKMKKEKEKEGPGSGVSGLLKSIPDIFGAAQSWMGIGKNDLTKMERRNIVDLRVARLMSEFWSTFAKYGDPNGLPIENGYKGDTRPPDAPWWPRLRGELYSQEAMRAMQAAAAVRTLHHVSREIGIDLKDGDSDMSKEGVRRERERGKRSGERERDSERERGRERGRRVENYRGEDRDKVGMYAYRDDESVKVSNDINDKNRAMKNRVRGRGRNEVDDSDSEDYQRIRKSGKRNARNKIANYDSDNNDNNDDDDDDDDEKESQLFFTFPFKSRDRNNERGSERDSESDSYRQSGRDAEGERGRGRTDGKDKNQRENRRRLQDREQEREQGREQGRDYSQDDMRGSDRGREKSTDNRDLSDYRNQNRNRDSGRDNGRDSREGEKRQKREREDSSLSRNDGREKRSGRASSGSYNNNNAINDYDNYKYNNYENYNDNSNDEKNGNKNENPRSSRSGQLPYPQESGKYMHLLRFDENTDVDIIKNNCICQFWDGLGMFFNFILNKFTCSDSFTIFIFCIHCLIILDLI